MSYSLDEIRLAAYNQTELPNMLPNESALWQGLAYCYEWVRLHPDEGVEESKALAQNYINFYYHNGRMEVMQNHSKAVAK